LRPHPARGARMSASAGVRTSSWRDALAHSAVPLLFALLCLFGIWAAHITPEFLAREMLARFGRNAILVLSLLIPILAGLGLNFGIVIGAMAGQAAAIAITYLHVRRIAGVAFALLIATPLAVL